MTCSLVLRVEPEISGNFRSAGLSERVFKALGCPEFVMLDEKFPIAVSVKKFTDRTASGISLVALPPGVLAAVAKEEISVRAASSDELGRRADLVVLEEISDQPVSADLQRLALGRWLQSEISLGEQEVFLVPLWGEISDPSERVFDVATQAEDPRLWSGPHRRLEKIFTKFLIFRVLELRGGFRVDSSTRILTERHGNILEKLPIHIRHWTSGSTSEPVAVAGAPCAVLVRGPRKAGKRIWGERAADSLGLHVVEIDCMHAGESEKIFQQVQEYLGRYKQVQVPALFLLRDVEAAVKAGAARDLATLAALIGRAKRRGASVVATTRSLAQAELGSVFDRTVDLANDLEFTNMQAANLRIVAETSDGGDERSLAKRQSSVGELAVVHVPWEHVGGLEEAKEELQTMLNAPKLRRRGVLLYGPPGSGKTLLAKAVATSLAAREAGAGGFLSVKGPELLSPYVGESEANIRAVFAQARTNAPCVLFFDEIDSLAPARGSASASEAGNFMDRVVSALCTEIDEISDHGSVLLVAATNRPDLLDSALLRPGRLDRCVFVGQTSGDSAVWLALSRKFRLSFPVESVLDLHRSSVEAFSGADVAGIFRNAQMRALERKARELELLAESRGVSLAELQTEDLELHRVTWEIAPDDLEAAIRETRPSVDAETLNMYESIRASFSSMCCV